MPNTERGFTYVGLLIAVAVFGLVSAASLQLGVAMQRRTAENELLERGERIVQALESYAKATTGAQPSRPARLEDLLRDPRQPRQLVRHLRRIEIDPMTGQADWVLVQARDGSGIVGVHSQSTQPVLRREHPALRRGFDEARTYQDWVFSIETLP